jgi:RNA recognition motif-containing protein
VHLVTDRVTGRSRGFAFVTMSSVAEGNAAIGDLGGKELDGRNLTLNEARPKEEGGKGGKRSFSRSRWHDSSVVLRDRLVSNCALPCDVLSEGRITAYSGDRISSIVS